MEKKHENNTSKRGFASMDEDKQREIASKGGRASHQSKSASSSEGHGKSETSRSSGSSSHGSSRSRRDEDE